MAQRVTGSHPGTMHARLDKTRGFGNWKVVALTTAAFAATFIGAPGLFASLGIDRFKNGEVAKDQRKILADAYREQIAAQLGMRPDQVTERDLRKAAEINPQFKQLIDKIEIEKERADRGAIAATAGGFALGGIMPGVSGLTHGVAATVGHVGGAIGGGMASTLLNKDRVFTQDIVEHMNAKISQGVGIDSNDVMMLRISQDPALQEQIQKQSGKAFHKMNPAEQRAVTASLPEMYASAESDAASFNSGRLTEQDLLVTSPGANQMAAQQQQQPAWTQRVGGPRQARQGSWTQAVTAPSGAAAVPGRG